MGWCRELVEPGRFDMWPFCIHRQLYPTHVPTVSPNVLLSTHLDQIDVVPRIFHLHARTHQLHTRRTKEWKHAHYNSPDLSPTNNFISHEVQTIHLVCMSRKGDKKTISTPRKPVHSAYMASKRSDELARLALLHTYAVIPSSRRCPSTVWGQSDVGDLALVAADGAVFGGGCEAGGRSVTVIQLS